MPVEQAVVDHDLLAAAALLGRRPEEDDLARQLVGERRQGDGGPDAGRRHRVVAAAVPETGQGVVFGQDPDPRTVPAATTRERRPDRGRERAGRLLDHEAVTGQDLGHPGGGLVLLERRLGVGVDPVRQVEDLGPGGLDGRGQARLGVGERRRGASRGQVGHWVSWLDWRDGRPA